MSAAHLCALAISFIVGALCGYARLHPILSIAIIALVALLLRGVAHA